MKENLAENQRDSGCFFTGTVPPFVSPLKNKHHQGYNEMLKKIKKELNYCLLVPSST